MLRFDKSHHLWYLDFEVMIMKKINGFEKYRITEDGKVFNSKKQMNHYVGKNGYCFIKLIDDNGITRHQSIHRLVASAYVENKQNKPCVNHIDGNRQNNVSSNLEWVTQQENLLKGYQRRNDTPIKFHKTCDLYFKDKFIKSFISIKEAARYAEENFNAKSTMLRKWLKNNSCQIKCNDYDEGQ